jgi:hypothetical protein
VNRFAGYFELYTDMFDLQLRWEVPELAESNRAMPANVTDQRAFSRDLGLAGQLAQAMVSGPRRL